jgi:predicted nucleic acid-binding protein
MLILLVDTNVVVDVILRRPPWAGDAMRLWRAIAEGDVRGYLSASVVTDVFYIVRRLSGIPTAKRAVDDYVHGFRIVPVGRRTLERALSMPGSDVEDDVQIVCALATGVDASVTRDPQGFRAAPVPVLMPMEAVARLP